MTAEREGVAERWVAEGWQPLATIPRDGTRVELLSASGETDFGDWGDFLYPEWVPAGWTPAIPGVLTGDLNTDKGLGDYTHWRAAPPSPAKEG